MKKTLLLMLGLFVFSASAQAAFYDFTAQGNHIEKGYQQFDSSTNPDSIMDGGLIVAAASGNVPGGPLDPAYAYMDSSLGGPGGLGVCKALRADGSCNPNSDDNQLSDEIVGMLFADATNYLGLRIIGDHEPVVPGTTFNWATEYSGGPGGETGSFDISGANLSLYQIFLSDWTDEFYYWITDGPDDRGQMYLASLTTVPVPAAFWLFGTALLGFISWSRRVKV